MLKRPQSMDECIYFTNRTIGTGKAMAWVFRKDCPKCKKGVMGKPIKKGGKIDKKAPNFVCYSCAYSEDNATVEASLMVNVDYKCPHCGNEGEATTEYKRKSFEGVQSYVFLCGKCQKKIGITKKLKENKKKKKSSDDEDDSGDDDN
jgi:DNA-directed RNA polymerase subunit M/transcription elongation factor TFIIS